MSEQLMDDEACRRMAALFGDALGAQIRNEEYLLSRCHPNDVAHHEMMLRNLRRASYLALHPDPRREGETT